MKEPGTVRTYKQRCIDTAGQLVFINSRESKNVVLTLHPQAYKLSRPSPNYRCTPKNPKTLQAPLPMDEVADAVHEALCRTWGCRT